MPDDPNVNENPTAGWWSGLDADHQSLITNRGYDKLDPAAAAVELAKAYRGSEKLRGGLASGDVVALPKDGDAAATKAFWERVGAPKDAAGYNFEGLKTKNGTALDEAYTDAARQAAAATNMPAHMLRDFLGNLQPHFDSQAEAAQVRATVDIEANRRELNHEWGPNTARNKFIAARAMDSLKEYLPDEAIAAMERLPGVGYKGVMKMMLHLGELQGEARFVSGAQPEGTLNPAQAQARLDMLKSDPAWRDRWQKGGAEGPEGQELSRLAAIIRGAAR